MSLVLTLNWELKENKVVVVNILKQNNSKKTDVCNCSKHIVTLLFTFRSSSQSFNQFPSGVGLIALRCCVRDMPECETNTNGQVSSRDIYKGFVICHVLTCCTTQANRVNEF